MNDTFLSFNFFCRTAKPSSVSSPFEIVMYKFWLVNNKYKKTFARELSTLTWFDLLDRNRLIIQIDGSMGKGTYYHACCPKFDPYGTKVGQRKITLVKIRNKLRTKRLMKRKLEMPHISYFWPIVCRNIFLFLSLFTLQACT